jgi:import inner membrane translocase subunit TIM16
MSGKIIAQIVIAGVQVFSKAFGLAYQQALKNAKSGPGAASAAAAASRGSKMAVDESLQVMNISRAELAATDATAKLSEKYTRMFEANDPENGGSFYLQSKVFRAKEALDDELADLRKSAAPTK